MLIKLIYMYKNELPGLLIEVLIFGVIIGYTCTKDNKV